MQHIALLAIGLHLRSGDDALVIRQNLIHFCPISPDGRYIASGSADGGLVVFDTKTMCMHSTLSAHSGAVSSAIWSPEQGSRSIASCDKNGFLVLWE